MSFMVSIAFSVQLIRDHGRVRHEACPLPRWRPSTRFIRSRQSEPAQVRSDQLGLRDPECLLNAFLIP